MRNGMPFCGGVRGGGQSGWLRGHDGGGGSITLRRPWPISRPVTPAPMMRMSPEEDEVWPIGGSIVDESAKVSNDCKVDRWARKSKANRMKMPRTLIGRLLSKAMEPREKGRR